MKPENPNLIKIGFTLLDKAATTLDPDFKAPASSAVWQPQVLADGSIVYVDREKLRQMPGGDRPVSDGHVMMWVDDLVAVGIDPKKGDRITSVAGAATDLMIIKVTSKVHVGGIPQVKIFDFEQRTTQ